jgi:transcriptional regulator with XRE-family HTH domain
MPEHSPHLPSPSAWEADRVGFARAITEARHQAGCSTRELARRARISQAYVVALEAGQRTPTIDVLARLAEALSIEPAVLLHRSLRRRGQHVLLVVDDDRTSVMQAARRLAHHPVDQWVWASSTGATPRGVHHRIDLRRRAERGYRPTDIARSLERELAGIAHDAPQQSLGLIFADTSSVMCALPDPGVLIDFEHGWADVVDRAATNCGATAELNVCVYRIDDLRSLNDPVAATLDVIRSHDTVWSANRNRLVGGDAAARRVLDLVGSAA